MIKPEWELSEDGKTLRVTLPTQPPIALELDAGGVDQFLVRLGTFRNVMMPEIPNGVPTGIVKSVPDPHWHVEQDAFTGRAGLHIRDTRYGWLHYLIPAPEARHLSALLAGIANRSPLPPTSMN
ncbi:hypothetical protein [Shinella sp.]|uniref:hypothetical protein n=1 Tax=Shinella sp. TaxID=1870904 RepID=UPI003F72FC9D